MQSKPPQPYRTFGAAKDSDAFKGLSETEKTVQLCLIYSAKVANGDHVQSIPISTGAYAAEAAHTLKIAVAIEMAVNLEKAMQIVADDFTTRARPNTRELPLRS